MDGGFTSLNGSGRRWQMAMADGRMGRNFRFQRTDKETGDGKRMGAALKVSWLDWNGSNG
jgi:hypothetical protein